MSKRYALVVDSKKCINCKACVVACRAENQVPLGHSRDWIGEEHRGDVALRAPRRSRPLDAARGTE